MSPTTNTIGGDEEEKQTKGDRAAEDRSGGDPVAFVDDEGRLDDHRALA